MIHDKGVSFGGYHRLKVSALMGTSGRRHRVGGEPRPGFGTTCWHSVT